MDLPDYRKRMPNARKLRRESTDAEKQLWRRLRDSRLEGWKFRRQVGMGYYIVDFFCLEAKLIIEVDGGSTTGSVRRTRRGRGISKASAFAWSGSGTTMYSGTSMAFLSRF
jgi:very-short-patch-repair endonuclease